MRPITLYPILILLAFLSSCQYFKTQNNLSEEDQLEMISRGNEIVKQSFNALSTELKQALESGGVQNAVNYCHLQASPIIDSLSMVHEAEISRVSMKYRNTANAPGQLDQTVLEAYQRQLAEGKELQPHLEVIGDEVIFYAPIVIQNPMCLLCHGEPGVTIDQANVELIRSKYPADLATGYQLDDFRGSWKVIMKKGKPGGK